MHPLLRSVVVSAFVVLIAACGSTKERSSMGETIDDGVITTKVKSLFVKDKKVDARDISVSTTKGVVTLKGEVDSQEDFDKAMELTRGVAGVKEVNNMMTIKK